MNLLARASNLANPTMSRGRDALRTYFLERLTRLEGMRTAPDSGLDSQQRRLLDHALYSTYWDCVNLGVRDDAQRLLGLEAVTQP